MKRFIIYDNEQGKACKKLLDGLENDFSLDYLLRFFEDKVKEYFEKEVANGEKVYDKEYDETKDYYDNYLFALKVKNIIEKLKRFKEYGYDFNIVIIGISEWYIEILWDETRLTKEQLNVIIFFLCERF